tara:strand:- start:397 stop:738 length:342 start_codon:yes stop_codon:yes gene_type:complete
MIIKYISFILGLIWSYSFIKTQSIFSQKTALLFKVFISKVSWITFIVACYFGYKNFSLKATVIGILLSIALVHVGFYLLGNYLKKRFGDERLIKIKTYFEYALVGLILYFVFY